MLQYNTIQYNTIQYNTIQYNTIQYNTIQYNEVRLVRTMPLRTKVVKWTRKRVRQRDRSLHASQEVLLQQNWRNSFFRTCLSEKGVHIALLEGQQEFKTGVLKKPMKQSLLAWLGVALEELRARWWQGTRPMEPPPWFGEQVMFRIACMNTQCDWAQLFCGCILFNLCKFWYKVLQTTGLILK